MVLQVTRLSPTEIESQFTVRPATLSDLDRALAFFNMVSQHATGADDMTREELAREWEQENLVIENNMRLVLTPDDEIVGYIEAWDIHAPYTQLGVWAAIHPAYETSGIAEYLFNWAEARLRQSLHKAPAGAKIVMRMGTRSEKTALQDAAKAQGMELVRNFFRMVIDFDGPPPAPIWPAGITPRTFIKGQDDRETYTVLDTAFRDHWGYLPRPFETGLTTWQHFTVESADFDPTLFFLAVDADNKIIGEALCEDSPTDLPGYGWVDDLAVLREGRGKGLGMALLLHAFGEFHRRGYQGCGLGVDAENLSGALRLYEKAGMRPTAQWNTYMKTLRDGVDYKGEV